jgi:hypothetical protein
MKLTFKYHDIFNLAMNKGAETEAMNLNPSRAFNLVQHYQTVFEIATFLEGFNLGRQYVYFWREGKSLLNMAINAGDIEPVDFSPVYHDDNTVTFEKIEK